MNNIAFFLLFTGVCGAMAWGCFQTITGDIAEKNWDTIQKSFHRWFFHGMSREQYIKQQKITAWFVMILSVVVWGMAMWTLIAGPVP